MDSRNDEVKKLLKANELAKVLDLPLSAIHRYARLGKLPVVRVGRQMRFSLPDVIVALREQPTRG